jgi:hypothetical protein
LKHALRTIPISSSECKWGFSQMNQSISLTRVSVMINTISAPLFTKVAGPFLPCFNPRKHIESW